MGYKVELYIYDLSRGMAKSLLPMLGLNFDLDGVWHTAIVVHDLEWFYGSSGIEHCSPGGTLLGQPMKIEQLGETSIDQETLRDYLNGLRNDRYHGRRYDLFKHNCNNFSNEIATFLCNKTIPRYILDLPDLVLSSPLAQMIRPLLEQALPHGSTLEDDDFVPQSQPQAANTKSAHVKKPDNSDTEYVRFDSAISSERVLTKLKELNEQSPEKITQDSLNQIRHQIDHPQEFNVKMWNDIFLPALRSWNLENIFPLMDIVRYCSSKSPLPAAVLSDLFRLLKSRDLISPNSPESVVRMVLRTLSNFFLFESTRSFFRGHAEDVINMLQTIIGPFSSGKDMLEIAASSIALNLAISLKGNHDQELAILLTSVLISNYVPEVKNYEALQRGLTALTILIKASEETKDFAMAMDLRQVLDKVPKFDSKIEDCIKVLVKCV